LIRKPKGDIHSFAPKINTNSEKIANSNRLNYMSQGRPAPHQEILMLKDQERLEKIRRQRELKQLKVLD
jgi:hypothetical protein